MTVVQYGSVNTTAAQVPGVLIQIVPPSQNYISGIPTDILGIVGTSTWGPVNSPVTVGAWSEFLASFGTIQNRKYDLATAAYFAILNGAQNIRAVRVTDGTDAAATGVLGTTGVTLTGKYTGSLGNSVNVAISAGSAASSWKVTVSLPGFNPEVFDNIGPGTTGNATWVAIAAAINSGINGLRGPSGIIIATAGASTTAPTASSVTLSGGTDGATTITSTVLLGADATTRTGMYALRNTGCAVVMLVDCDTPASWTTQVAYGLSEGSYMIMTGPAGDTIANAITTKATAAIDNYDGKVLFGDWCYVQDPINNVSRYISPQSFLAAELVSLSPEQSGLNKQLFGIVGTQKTATGTTYTNADLLQLKVAGIDVITNPAPGGNYFASVLGCNTSSNPAINGDNYSRLTNYLAYSLDATMGIYVGRLQTPGLRITVSAAISAFLQGMQDAGMIGDVNNPQANAYSVVCNGTNNPDPRVALGFLQVDVQVKYLSVVNNLVVNVQGGQTVSITSSVVTA